MQEKFESSLGRLICWGLIAATIFITPWWAVDPINPIKMAVIVPVGLMSVALLLTNRNSVKWSKYRVPLGLIAAFVIWQIIVLFASNGEIYQQLFGAQGRNTGFITYVAFSCIFVGSIISSTKETYKTLISTVLVVGTLSLGYGVIQAVGLDPIQWANQYSPVFGAIQIFSLRY